MTGPLSAFIEDAYQDTLSLMTELRDFLVEVQAAPEDAEASETTEVRARIVREISAITRNLTADGLLIPGDAARIAATNVAELPLEIRGYMDRSRWLYDQVISLREMAAKQAR
jgi:hypothetical protein